MMTELLDLLNNISLTSEIKFIIVLALSFFGLNYKRYIGQAKENKEKLVELFRNLFPRKEGKIVQENKKGVVNMPSSDDFVSRVLGIQAFFTFVLSIYAGFKDEKAKFLIGIIFSIVLAIASRYFFIRAEKVYDLKES